MASRNLELVTAVILCLVPGRSLRSFTSRKVSAITQRPPWLFLGDSSWITILPLPALCSVRYQHFRVFYCFGFLNIILPFWCTTDPLNRNEFEECCRPPHGSPPNKYCFNIDVPHNDEFFSRFGVRCIDFVRGFPGVRHGCRLGKHRRRLFLQIQKLSNLSMNCRRLVKRKRFQGSVQSADCHDRCQHRLRRQRVLRQVLFMFAVKIEEKRFEIYFVSNAKDFTLWLRRPIENESCVTSVRPDGSTPSQNRSSGRRLHSSTRKWQPILFRCWYYSNNLFLKNHYTPIHFYLIAGCR